MMNYKWNAADAETYAKAFSNLICNEFFKNQERISGGEILEVSEIKQLNLLVVRNLFEKWREESSRLKSPYFNFEQEEVKSALTDFMNILSRFISVKRDKFEALLASSVEDTLQLCLAPKSYFENLMRHLPEFKLTSEWVDGNQKYFQVNKFALDALASKLGKERIFANQAIDWVKDIFDQNAGEDAGNILEDFDAILPISFGVTKQKKSFFEEALYDTTSKVEKLKPTAVEPEITAKIVKTTTVKSAASKVTTISQKESNEPYSLNDKLTVTGVKTLNERIVFDGGKTLSDRLQKSKIESLTVGVSLNQRFQFVKNLFGGDMDAYNNNMNALNTYNSLGEVKSHISEHIAPRYEWDGSTDEIEEFYAFVERKFA